MVAGIGRKGLEGEQVANGDQGMKLKSISGLYDSRHISDESSLCAPRGL